MWGYDPYYNPDEYRYYRGYMLDDVCSYDLTDLEKEILDNAKMLVDENWSLRELSRNVGRSRSQLSRDFQKPLKSLSYDLYGCVRRVLRNNSKKYFKNL